MSTAVVLGDVESRARIAFRDQVRAKHHHRSHFTLRQQVADAGGMAANQVDLQLGQAPRGNGDVGEFAEARGHTVGNGAARDEIIDDLSSAAGALARMRGE